VDSSGEFAELLTVAVLQPAHLLLILFLYFMPDLIRRPATFYFSQKTGFPLNARRNDNCINIA
jgi:hypothetical protein